MSGALLPLYAVFAVTVVLFCLTVIDARMLPAGGGWQARWVSLSCAGAGVVAWLILARVLAPGQGTSILAPLAGLGGVAAYLATIAVRASGGGAFVSVTFAALWSALVYGPIALRSFAPFDAQRFAGIHVIDHGGSLPLNVAAGAAALGVLAFRGPRSKTSSIRGLPGALAIAGLASGWIAWLAAAEFAVDESLALIVVNGLIGAVAGVVGWLAVQRIRHRSVSLHAVAAGLISGLVAITAGAPLLTPVSAAASGAIAGALACLVTLTRVARSRRRQWFLVGSHLVAGATGVVLLGLLATNLGFVFTGSITFIQTQLIAVVLVTVWSGGVSAVLWFILSTLQTRLVPSLPTERSRA